MQTKRSTEEGAALKVTSSAFKPNGYIPVKYTCKGEDVNPPLDVSGMPAQTKGLTLIIDDPDAPGGSWLHWTVWNIPLTHHLMEDYIPGQQGKNDFGRTKYGGPCPPSGTHRYFFKVYALDEVLDLTEGASRRELETAMKDHIVGYGELIGLCKK
jgi:Raf kinase inhibitor-like YbhB/YbcL family protein